MFIFNFWKNLTSNIYHILNKLKIENFLWKKNKTSAEPFSLSKKFSTLMLRTGLVPGDYISYQCIITTKLNDRPNPGRVTYPYIKHTTDWFVITDFESWMRSVHSLLHSSTFPQDTITPCWYSTLLTEIENILHASQNQNKSCNLLKVWTIWKVSTRIHFNKQGSLFQRTVLVPLWGGFLLCFPL